MSDRDLASREFTDAALAELRAAGLRPAGWGRFLMRISRRSAGQVAARPRAVAEVTTLHAAASALAARSGSGARGQAWVAASWALAVTHLGMLEDRHGLGVANVLTLARANLPAMAHDRRALVAVLAAATDFADGQLSRRTGTTSLFGQQADPLTDAAVWTWLALRHEPSRATRIATLAGWVAVVGSVTAASFARGAMIDPPRPKVVRPSAAMQVLLTIRALRRHA